MPDVPRHQALRALRHEPLVPTVPAVAAPAAEHGAEAPRADARRADVRGRRVQHTAERVQPRRSVLALRLSSLDASRGGSPIVRPVGEILEHGTFDPAESEVVERADRPFAQAIFDIDVQCMAFGRVCLIGDAAFAVRPHIAAGTAKAAADAWALAEALERADMDVDRALRVWGSRQLTVGRAALERARCNGNRSQFDASWTPGDPDLDFGLAP